MDRGSVFFFFVFTLPSFTFGIFPTVYLLNVWNKSHENGVPIVCINFFVVVFLFFFLFSFFLFGSLVLGFVAVWVSGVHYLS